MPDLLVPGYSHLDPRTRQRSQGGPDSSHLTRRDLQVPHPLRDLWCERRLGIVEMGKVEEETKEGR